MDSEWLTILCDEEDMRLEREIRDLGWDVYVYTLAKVERFGFRIIGYRAEAVRDGSRVQHVSLTPTQALRSILTFISKDGV